MHRQPADQAESELGPNNGERLEQVLLFNGQTVDTRGEDVLHGRWDGELIDRTGQLDGAVARQRPSSNSTWTVSSIKNGLPSIFSIIRSSEPRKFRAVSQR